MNNKKNNELMILLNIEDLTFEKNNVRYTYNIKNFNHHA